jgi:hypothetical protein
MILQTFFVLFIAWESPPGANMNLHYAGAQSMEECVRVMAKSLKSPYKPLPVKIAKCEAVKKWEGQKLKYDDWFTL